jgi:hypothetical protein
MPSLYVTPEASLIGSSLMLPDESLVTLPIR